MVRVWINILLVSALALACGQNDSSQQTIPTVKDFSQFIEKTDIKTSADDIGWVGIYDEKYGRWRRLLGGNFILQDGKTTAPEDSPLCFISWDEANRYCNSLSKRLPTLNELEHVDPINGLTGEWTSSPYTLKERRHHFESAMLINGIAIDGYYIRTYRDTIFNVAVPEKNVPAEGRYGLEGIGCRCVQ